MKTRRTLVFAVLIAGALAACWWYFLRKSPNEPLVMYGNVEVRQVNLGFKMAGRIEKLNVDEGDAVRPGEVLASLEKVYFYDALAQALAQRGQIAANYAKLRAGNRPEEIAKAKALVAEREATLTNARIPFTPVNPNDIVGAWKAPSTRSQGLIILGHFKSSTNGSAAIAAVGSISAACGGRLVSSARIVDWRARRG